MKNTKDKLQDFIKQMSHFDPDNMEMGAKAVTELVLSGDLDLENNETKANRIREAFMKQMESDNYNVHAYAIRCVADMVPKLPSKQVEIIFSKIINSIADEHLDEKKREIYGVCAGTVIHQASEQYGEKLSDLFVHSIKQLMLSRDRKSQIEVMLINVISEFIRKWPNIAGNPQLNFDRVGLCKYLLNNIQSKSKVELIKKSQTAIGKLALILNRDQLSVLLEDKTHGLLFFIAENKGVMSPDKLRNERNGLICLSQVLKGHNSEIRFWAVNIAQLLVSIIRVYPDCKDMENIDYVCDIVETALICLSYTVKSYFRELNKLLQSPVNSLNNFVLNLINFDKEGMMSYAIKEENQGDMQEEYEDYGDYDYDQGADVDEKCWKVRRAAIHYTMVLIKRDKHFKDNLNKGFIETLGNKLIEENMLVSEKAIEAFNGLIQSISVHKTHLVQDDAEELSLVRIKSTEGSVAECIIREVANNLDIIFNNSKFNDEIRNEASKVLLRIVQYYKDQLVHMTEMSTFLVKLLENELKHTNVPEIQHNLLLALRQIISNSIQFSLYQPVLNTITKMTSVNNLKLVSAAYKVIRKFITEFPNEFMKAGSFPQILKGIKKRLKEHDADRLVKSSVLKCVGPLFFNYSDRLKDHETDLLILLRDKLKVEIQKTYILEQIIKIPERFSPNKNSIQVLKELVELAAQHLSSVNFDLSFKACEAIRVIVVILEKHLDQHLANLILTKTKQLFYQSKIPHFVGVLMDRFPNQFKGYAETIIKTAEKDYIVKMLQLKIVNLELCLKVLRGNQKPQKMKKVSEVLGTIGVPEKDLLKSMDQTLWGRTCTGALGYVGNEQTGATLLQMLVKNKTQEIRFQIASALGNIASRHQGSFMTRIMQGADSSQANYIFIYALKEMLSFTSVLKDIGNLSSWLMSKAEQKYEGESTYYVISQCIGLIAFKSENELNGLMQYQKGSENQRFVVANSLRFALEGKENLMETDGFRNYITLVIHMVSDSSVQVRYGATKSLCIITEQHFKLIKSLISVNFWNALKKNALIDSSLIIEVDYGISKEKKDLGKPLRLESFNLIKTLTNRLSSFENTSVEDLMAVCLDQLNKQTNTDIVLRRMGLLRDLCQIDYTQFIGLQNEFIKKMGIEQGILKAHRDGKNMADERVDVYLRSLLKLIVEINVLAEKENINQIKNFIAEIKTKPRYNELMQVP